MPTEQSKPEQYGAALLRDDDFTRLLDEDLAAERRGEVDHGLTDAQFRAKYRHLLEPPAG